MNHRDAATEVRNASTGVGWQSGDRVTTSLNIAGFVRLSACTVQVTSPVIVLSVVFGTIRTLNSFGSNECVKGGGIVDHCGPFLNIYYTEGFSGSSVYSERRNVRYRGCTLVPCLVSGGIKWPVTSAGPPLNWGVRLKSSSSTASFALGFSWVSLNRNKPHLRTITQGQIANPLPHFETEPKRTC